MSIWYAQGNGLMSQVNWNSQPDGRGDELSSFPPPSTDELHTNGYSLTIDTSFQVATIHVTDTVIIDSNTPNNTEVTATWNYGSATALSCLPDVPRTITLKGAFIAAEGYANTAIFTSPSAQLVVNLRDVTVDPDDAIGIQLGSNTSLTLANVTFVQGINHPCIYVPPMVSSSTVTWYNQHIIGQDRNCPMIVICESSAEEEPTITFDGCIVESGNVMSVVGGTSAGSLVQAPVTVHLKDSKLIMRYNETLDKYTNPLEVRYIRYSGNVEVHTGDVVWRPSTYINWEYDHVGGVLQRAKPREDLVFGWRIELEGQRIRCSIVDPNGAYIVKDHQPVQSRVDPRFYYYVLPGKYVQKDGLYMGVLSYQATGYGEIEFRQFYAVGEIPHGMHSIASPIE
jgi:hypothetical protein